MANYILMRGWYEAAVYPIRDGYGPYYFDGNSWYEVDAEGEKRTESDEPPRPFYPLGGIYE